MWDRVPALSFFCLGKQLEREGNRIKIKCHLIYRGYLFLVLHPFYPVFPGPITPQRLLIVHSQEPKAQSDNLQLPLELLHYVRPHDTSVAIALLSYLSAVDVKMTERTASPSVTARDVVPVAVPLPHLLRH